MRRLLGRLGERGWLRCLVGRHDAVRVIDEAHWQAFSSFGYQADIVREHRECQRCGKVLS